MTDTAAHVGTRAHTRQQQHVPVWVCGQNFISKPELSRLFDVEDFEIF